MKKQKVTTWFLHANNAHGNEVLAQVLYGSHTVDIAKEHVCSDGVKRFLYQVPDHTFAQRMVRSAKQLSATFLVFRSENEGVPAEVNFDIIKKKTVKRTLAKLKKASDEIKFKATMPKHRK